MSRFIAAATVLATLSFLALPSGHERASGESLPRPNIVVVMTDDQDARTLDRIPGLPQVASRCSASQGVIMPCLDELVRSRGVTFGGHTAAYPLCCPSRATYITGQYPHNHHVRANGDYDRLDKEHVLPIWLQQAGYATAYVGKYQGPFFLGYGQREHPDGRPKGWDHFWGLIDAAEGVSAYNYFHYVIDADGVPEPHGEGEAEYQTNVLTEHATDFIAEQEADDDKPFYLSVGYVGPHWSNSPNTTNDTDIPALAEGDPNFEAQQAPPVPAPRHMDELAEFMNAEVHPPRTAAFNEADVSDKPAFVRNRRPLNDSEIARIDHWYQRRLATLLAVDEGIEAMVEELRRAGELENTYFIFTSDNGWLQGEHRLAFQKQHAYQESAGLPLVVAGPRVKHGTVQEPTSNVDVAATILGLSGARPNDGFEIDGMSLAPYLRNPNRHVGRAIFQESTTGADGYVGVRTKRWRYVEYNGGERELYDLRNDPAETTNLGDDPALANVRQRLAELVERFRTCRGQDGAESCVRTGQG